MATLAEVLLGADMEGYEPFCEEVYNNLKNHWRRAGVRTTLTEAQPGMIGDDSADNTLWHCIAPGAPPTWRQIVQTTIPVLDDLAIYRGTDSDASERYDETTNDAWIFGVPVSPKRGIIYCRQADIAQNFTSLIAASTEVRKHIIDADKDSFFTYGFSTDDVPYIDSNRIFLFACGMRHGKISESIKGADKPSAATLDISQLDGNYFDITGTTNITAISTSGQAGTQIKLHFDATVKISHHATNLILFDGRDIYTHAGDELEFVEYDTAKWRLVNWLKAGYRAPQEAIKKISEEGFFAGLAEDFGRYPWVDLGTVIAGETIIRSLAYLGDGIALAGTAPNGKIARSTDYGATWSDLGQQFSQTEILFFCYLGDGIALAGTAPNGKIARSN